jgi:AAA+ superfamily predicted ATPase
MLDSLKLYLQAGVPLLSVQTHDEDQATAIARKAADQLAIPLFEWTVTTGLVRTRPTTPESVAPAGKPVVALEYVARQGNGELFLFKDLASHTRDPLVQRLIRDHVAKKVAHILLVDVEPPTDSIRRLTVPLNLPLPDVGELEEVIRATFKTIKQRSLSEVTSTVTKLELEQMVQTLRGLTCTEAAQVVATAIHDDHCLSGADLPRIVEAKRNRLQSVGCLEAVNVNVQVDQVGGLANLKGWLSKRRGGFTRKAANFGLRPPRGLLLLGVQGCGKSLCAKMIASAWTMPLLRLDPSALYTKYVGESERRLRDAFEQAETMAPAVLWIEEIEKGFASAGSESVDGGLSKRMFGTLLSWMQDHQSPLFTVATANDIESLPPELMRKGRFDEVFFVDLPDQVSRKQILSIHLARLQRELTRFNLDELAQATAGFSGAEIEQVVMSALYRAYAEDIELTQQHLTIEVASTRPLSTLMREKVEALRQWARERCVPADELSK